MPAPLSLFGLAVACAVILAGTCSALEFPSAELSARELRIRLYLPDARQGFYRGTRFDWSGVIGSLEHAGHEYYPAWFARVDPQVHDFIYDGADIVACPCTAMTGPAEEFTTDGQGLGFDNAKVGGTFVKIGVGVLRRPDDAKYDPYRLYEIVDGGKWIVDKHPDSIEFIQELADPSTGFGYIYRKTVSIAPDRPRMLLAHSLRNTGKRPIHSSVYNHNFLYLDRRAPGPEVTLTFPFTIRTAAAPDRTVVEISGHEIRFAKTLAGQDRAYLNILGFGAEAKDYDIRVENQGVGAGVRITADRPLARLSLWAIRAPVSIEPFIDMTIEPGAEFTWTITYDYYTLPGVRR